MAKRQRNIGKTLIPSEKGGSLVSVIEYRKLLGDTKSKDESIIKKLQFLEAFCINMAKIELQKYVEKNKRKD